PPQNPQTNKRPMFSCGCYAGFVSARNPQALPINATAAVRGCLFPRFVCIGLSTRLLWFCRWGHWLRWLRWLRSRPRGLGVSDLGLCRTTLDIVQVLLGMPILRYA